jgi:uncharacterized membrane protein YphA (DoxX/SURF4 family)
MEDNLALPRGFVSGSADRVKAVVGGIAAVLLAILFCVSGGWKLVKLYEWSQAMGQFQVPSDIKLPFTILVGVGEMLGAALIVVPRFRRWGSWIIGLLLIAFMGYIGWKYNILVGKDCSCFPLVKRSVGPMFFVVDGVMLLFAVIAGWFAPKPHGLRGALVILGAIVVFAGVSYGINANANSGLQAPKQIAVDGKPYSLEEGNVFLFFFDPECSTCFGAAQRMSKLNWKDTKVVAIPTRVPQFASGFLRDSNLQAGISLDKDLLTPTFKFISPPYGVALHFGRQRAFIDKFDPDEPAKTLRSIGFAQ